MKGSGEKLTRKQEQALAALLSETTVSAAAEKAGVNEVTLYRWLKQHDFTAVYREARRTVLEKAFAQLQQSSWAASTTLLKLLGSSSDSVRLRAATTSATTVRHVPDECNYLTCQTDEISLAGSRVLDNNDLRRGRRRAWQPTSSMT